MMTFAYLLNLNMYMCIYTHTNEILKVHLFNFTIYIFCTSKEEPQSKTINSQIKYSIVTVSRALWVVSK